VNIWPDVTACLAAEYPRSVTNKIEIAMGIWIDAVFEITSKGNGGVELPGLGVRVYDSHDDELVFRDWLLRCEWRDDDGNGVLDFVVTGVAVQTDEKSGAERSSLPVRGAFRYITKQRRFEPTLCSPEIYYWER